MTIRLCRRIVLSRTEARNCLEAIADGYRLSHPDGLLLFDPDMLAGKGDSDGEKPERLIIGTKGVYTGSSSLVDERTFMRALVAIYHEIRHADQAVIIERQNDALGREIGLSRIAKLYNPHYTDQNYYINPREVDAEREGMFGAYGFCIDNFGEDKANQMLCDYVNDRISIVPKLDVSFIHPERGCRYHDAMDIFRDMDKAYDRSIHACRKYDVQEGLKVNDQIARFLTEQPQYRGLFLSESDGQRQDRMSAAVALDYGGASYEERMLPGLQGITISSAFTCDEGHANRAVQADEKFGYIAGVSDSECDEYEP